MGTSSSIGIKQSNGQVRAITCHWDGYPEHVGRVLHEFYGDEAKATRLLRLGDLSSLGESLAPPPGVRHTFDHPAKAVTVAYRRERGDDVPPPATFADAEDYRMNAKSRFMADYVYLLADGVWQMAIGHSWVPVASVLKKDGNNSNKSGCRLDKQEPGRLLNGVPTRCGDNQGNTETTMANTCFIRLLAVCGDSAQATRLTARLNALAIKAGRKQEDFDAGGGLYIFDAEASQLTRCVVLEGWVKWGIDDAHAVALVRFLQGLVDLKAAFIECCTPDSEFYGEIYWSEGRLTARELPYEWWVAGEYEYGEDKAAINKALAAHGVDREIKMEADK